MINEEKPKVKKLQKEIWEKSECDKCTAFKKLEEIALKINKLPKLCTSLDYRRCIDEIIKIINRNE